MFARICRRALATRWAATEPSGLIRYNLLEVLFSNRIYLICQHGSHRLTGRLQRSSVTPVSSVKSRPRPHSMAFCFAANARYVSTVMLRAIAAVAQHPTIIYDQFGAKHSTLQRRWNFNLFVAPSVLHRGGNARYSTIVTKSFATKEEHALIIVMVFCNVSHADRCFRMSAKPGKRLESEGFSLSSHSFHGWVLRFDFAAHSCSCADFCVDGRSQICDSIHRQSGIHPA